MYQRIDKQTAKHIIETEKNILIDIRDLQCFNNGHLAKAIHIGQYNLQNFIAETCKTISILVMCYHGNSSQSVAHYLSEEGFTKVYSIDGGYEEWNE